MATNETANTPTTTYDTVYLASNEWGNETMRKVAMDYFATHSVVQFVLVHEHGGWRLGYRRDGSFWGSANDCAVLDKGSRPTGWSGVDVRRESQKAVA